MPIVHTETVIQAPPEVAFDLARSVDAHVESTSRTRESAVGGKTSGLLELGDRVTWRARHFGIWQQLTSEITRYDRPRHFRDSMVEGAFARFDHDHWFEPDRAGTLMTDRFDFNSPLGPIGWAFDAVVLESYLRRFLEGRNRLLGDLAASGEWRRFVPEPCATSAPAEG